MELIDVSNAQGAVDWRAVKKAGVAGAWHKATEGATFDDAWFAANRRRAGQAGVRFGAYHFARPDRNKPETEADHFCRVVGKLDRRDLRPVLDLEQETTLKWREIEEWARAFNRRVRAHLGVTPVFYSYPAYIASMSLERTIGNGLWLASYGPNDGRRHTAVVPKPWKRYVAHQYTSTGSVPGVHGHVDRSYAPRLRGVLARPIAGLL